MKRSTVDRTVEKNDEDKSKVEKKQGDNILTKVTPFQEEIFNVLSHAIFILPCIMLTVEMVERSTSMLQFRISILYGTCAIFLYTISATFHGILLLKLLKIEIAFLEHGFHLADRFMIYIFIAASYMPWLLLQGDVEWGFKVAYFVWALALSGVIYTIFFLGWSTNFELFLYLALGFGPAIFVAQQSMMGFGEIVVGGLLYVVGVVFFKLEGKVPFAHAIWHLFVAAGMWTHTHDVWIHFY